MIRDFARKIRGLSAHAVPFDPTALGDDVALRTEWGPAKQGGASFGTHRLVSVHPRRLEFRPAPGAVVFYAVFLVVGVGALIGSVVAVRLSDSDGIQSYLLPLLVGSIFTVAGGLMMYFGTAPVVFDQSRGEYWKGRVPPHEATRRDDVRHYAKLDDIHALQIVSEHCRGKNTSYYSYELNLVLKDGERMNVVDHGNQGQLAADARTLSDFLERPLWDATH